jgi:DNA-binding response OmpR family regulator
MRINLSEKIIHHAQRTWSEETYIDVVWENREAHSHHMNRLRKHRWKEKKKGQDVTPVKRWY